MKKMKWTDSQDRAITIDADKVIVSAAAGSGKTGVLTQRVIRLVKEKNDIRRMLIMTFTNAAAAEMKKRIIKALSEEAQKAREEKLPEAEYLFEQAELADGSAISTFHSFCIELLRENFNIADVSPNFKILGDSEAAALQHEAMREVLDELYENGDLGVIRLLARYTSKYSEEELIRMLLKIYEKARNQPGIIKWITNGAELGKERTAVEKAQKVYRDYEGYIRERLKYYAENLAAAIELENEFNLKINKGASNRIEDLKTLKTAIKSDLEEAYKIITQLKFKSAPKMSAKYTEEEKEEVREIKKYLITARDLRKKVLKPGNPSLIKEEVFHTDKDAHTIADIIKKFDDAYTEKKKERNGIDFDDAMIKTIDVLEQNPDIAQKFDYIFVDEYQDTNPIQDRIINLLKRDNPAVNLFMVGDMKQSIYRFRNADPSLFKGKGEEYKELGFEPITMNDNFRSCEAVINAVNGIMENLMSEEFGDVKYGKSERLVGKKEGGKAVLLLGEVDDAEINKDTEDNSVLTGGELRDDVEAQAIADSIEKTLNECGSGGKPKYAPEDIAVLARKIKGNGVIKALMKKLSEKGILYSLAKNQLSDTPEIELFVNLLKIIENPENDIALVSVLKSEIGGFDENELAEIHIAADPKQTEESENEHKHKYFNSFYDQLYNYKKKQKDAKLTDKVKVFLKKLKNLQLTAQCESLPDFISSLRDDFNFDSSHTFMRNGNLKREVFEKFMDYVQEICTYSDNNLFRLISELEAEKKRSINKSYINIETDDDLPAVSIMSMHKSKGLEFPVVYLADLSADLESGNKESFYRTTKEDGLILPYRDEQTLDKRDGIMLTIAKERLMRENRSEYLRLLYVAMTRAKERLYLCGTVDKKGDASYLDQDIDIEKKAVMLDWIIAADPRKYGIEIEDAAATYAPDIKWGKESGESIDIRIERLSKKEGAAKLYAPAEIKSVPQKISVSDVKEAQTEEDESRKYKALANYLKPAAEESEEGEALLLSAASLGTLIHKVMEHILKYDLNTEQTAKKMRENNLLTEDEYETVLEYKDMADGFLKDDLYRRIKKSNRLLEEQRFLLNVPANKLGLGYKSEKPVTVQGILDAAFLEDGKWVLIDYKTDDVNDKDIDERVRYYKIQLDLYSDALKEITGIPVKERYLYFLRKGKLKAV